MTRLLIAAGLLALAPLTGCGTEEDHAHGPDTHTHEEEAPAAAPAAPSSTYLDTTTVAPDTTGFFEEAEAAAEAAHEAAGEHTHDDGTTHDH